MGSIVNECIFESQIDGIIEYYPKLAKFKIGGNYIIKGEVELVDIMGDLIDTYQIEIHQTSEFPFRFPFLYETGGRIPRNIDWHVFEQTGHCCIKVIPEEILICSKGIILLEFLKGQVIPYLFNQTFRRLNGFFLNERSHGVKGCVEFYFDQLRVNNIYDMVFLLQFIQKGIEPSKVRKCFCGSGKKYSKCHRTAFRNLVRIGSQELQKHINIFGQLLLLERNVFLNI